MQTSTRKVLLEKLWILFSVVSFESPSSGHRFDKNKNTRKITLSVVMCSSAVAATCDALSTTSLVARKLLGASFSLVRKCAGKPLLQL